MKQKHIFLSITERCNLNCIYCFEKSKRPDSMSTETALSYIRRELYSEEPQHVTVDFLGGEPFLEFEKIKTICETVWEKQWKNSYNFYCVTNGTLVHGEIKQWLEKHSKQFICALSIDGRKQTHDINRSKSFDRIDVGFFRQNWPFVRAKTICSKKTLNMLADSVKYIYGLGFPDIDLKLAYSFDWSDAAEMKMLREQLDILVDFFFENPQYKPFTLLNINLGELNFDGKPIRPWCTLGGETLSVDMFGKLFPCRYFQDLVRNNKISYSELCTMDFSDIHNTLKGKCIRCLIRDVCRTCYAYNLDTCGDFGIKNNYSCKMSRISANSTAKLVLKKLSSIPELSADDLKQKTAAEKVIAAYDNNSWFI